MISAAQMKVARSLLGWNQGNLANKTGISVATIQRMEQRGLGHSSTNKTELVQRTLERAGIRFVSGGAIWADETPDKEHSGACLSVRKSA